MTKQTPEEFIRSLLSNLVPGTVDRAERIQTLLEIHNAYDADLANALGRWLESQKVKNSQVLSTLCHMVSVELALMAPDHSSVCSLSDAYGDYIHQAAHGHFPSAEALKKPRGRRK